jgi:iron complex outermembrane receptor protein
MYLQWQANWNAYFSVLISARYDNNSMYGDNIVPRLGFVFTPRPETIFKFMYGEGLRAPSSRQSNSTVLNFNSGRKNEQGDYISNYLLIANPELKPEELRTIEVSLTNHFTPDFSLSLAAYYTRMRNLIATINGVSPDEAILPSIPKVEIDPLLISQFQNLGRGRHYGIDLQAQYQRKLNADWYVNLWGNYSYVDGYTMFNNRQTELPYVSENLFKFGTSFTYRDRYFITTRLFAADKTNTDLAPQSAFSSQGIESGAYAVVDLRLGAYHVYHGLSAYVDVLNVFDREYTHAGQSFIASLRGVPQPERSFYFSLQYDFQ